MDLWIATTNKGKLTEFKVLLNSLPQFTLHSTSELPVFSPPPENGQTYLENARIKARSLKAVKPEAWVLADDTGIEVMGLGNKLPGVHSARYAGPNARDSENRAKLLKMMQIRNILDRSARFCCYLVVLNPQGEEWVFEGVLDGQIATKESGGVYGFGYDSIFIPKGETKTLSELEPAYKNKNSHRALAVQSFIKRFNESLS